MVPFAWYGASGLVHIGAPAADCEAHGLVGAPLAWFGASDLIGAPIAWCTRLWPGGSASGPVDMPLAW